MPDGDACARRLGRRELRREPARSTPDRANLAGITNLDVAAASAAGLSGSKLTTLREGDKQIPIVARLRMDDGRASTTSRTSTCYSSQGTQKVPLEPGLVARLRSADREAARRNQFRTITVSCIPPKDVRVRGDEGCRAEAEGAREPRSRPATNGDRRRGGGAEEGFINLAVVLLISVTAIFLALVFQFRNAVKPLIVFAAVPYGMVGALAALWVTGTPFGFMAFLGIVSLVGVIVSHVIVLFDFIEEAHAEGEPLREALLDAGIIRLRPVLITVGATVIALFPLAAHGGPLWEPMCYAQIGGLTVATFITLVLVPVIYSIFVLDLKFVGWDAKTEVSEPEPPSPQELTPAEEGAV